MYLIPIQLPLVVSVIVTETNGGFFFKGIKSPLSVGDLEMKLSCTSSSTSGTPPPEST